MNNKPFEAKALDGIVREKSFHSTQDLDILHTLKEVEDDVSSLLKEEIEKRRANWTKPPLKATSGALYKYSKVVSSAALGCVTDL